MHPTLSQLALAFVLSLSSLGLGYQLGSRYAHCWRSRLAMRHYPKDDRKDVPLLEVEKDWEDLNHEDNEDDEGIPDGDLSSIKAGILEGCKMVMVVRKDLKLSPGDIVSQCSQATLACYKALIEKNVSLVKHWERTGQAKIALKCKSEDQLLELEAIAKSLNLCARTIRARNVNGVQDGTPTVLAIGPAPVNLVNEVTSELRLL